MLFIKAFAQGSSGGGAGGRAGGNQGVPRSRGRSLNQALNDGVMRAAGAGNQEFLRAYNASRNIIRNGGSPSAIGGRTGTQVYGTKRTSGRRLGR